MKKDVKTYVVLAAAAVLVISLLVFGFADGNTPGSAEDPIVTQSYVTQVTDKLKTYVDSAIAAVQLDVARLNSNSAANAESINALKAQLDAKSTELTALQEQMKNQAAATYEVILVKKGSTLLSGKGTEIIVRSGVCTAIASANGGLANATEGKDLKTGEQITLNHLLISSRDDGRGLKVVEDAYMIVRGTYTLK